MGSRNLHGSSRERTATRGSSCGWSIAIAGVVACSSPSTPVADTNPSTTTTDTAPASTSPSLDTSSSEASVSSTEPAPGTSDTGYTTSAGSETLELAFVYVHGIKSCDPQQIEAAGSLEDLRTAVELALPERIAAFEAARGDVHVESRSAAVNIYLADPSPDMPAGEDPTDLDRWHVGFGECGSELQGDPCTTAYEWRYRLREQIEQRLRGAEHIVLIGHSTGARAAVELAADVGPGGIGTGGFGMADRILGTVSVSGMIDSLANYDLIGPFGFATVCSTGGGVLDVFGGCDPGDGWCEYATHLSGVEATRWLAQSSATLSLTSVQDCGVAFFAGEGDGSLPVAAQGAPFAYGLALTPAAGSTLGPAHGLRYGGFCHSAIDTASTEGHAQAVESVRDRVLEWLFERAPIVVSEGTQQTETALAPGETTPWIEIGDADCPDAVESYEAFVEGVRLHPGFFDGDDAPIDAAEIQVELIGNCRARFAWTQDGVDGSHDARFHWQIAADTGNGALARRLLD